MRACVRVCVCKERKWEKEERKKRKRREKEERKREKKREKERKREKKREKERKRERAGWCLGRCRRSGMMRPLMRKRTVKVDVTGDVSAPLFGFEFRCILFRFSWFSPDPPPIERWNSLAPWYQWGEPQHRPSLFRKSVGISSRFELFSIWLKRFNIGAIICWIGKGLYVNDVIVIDNNRWWTKQWQWLYT